MMCWNFMVASYRATYIRYIKVGVIMIKHKGVPPLHIDPGRDLLAAMTLGVTDLYGPKRYIRQRRTFS